MAQIYNLPCQKSKYINLDIATQLKMARIFII